MFGCYLSLIYMDTQKGSSKDPEGGRLGIRGWEGMGMLDRETLSGSLLGMAPCFPVAGALDLRLRLAAACCDSIPATASQIWAGCQRVPSQSGHTQCQITSEVASSPPQCASCHPSQMWIPLNPQGTQMQTQTRSSNSECAHIYSDSVCVCMERRWDIKTVSVCVFKWIHLCIIPLSVSSSDLSPSWNYYTTSVWLRGGKLPQLHVELCLTLVDNLSNAGVLVLWHGILSTKHFPEE